MIQVPVEDTRGSQTWLSLRAQPGGPRFHQLPRWRLGVFHSPGVLQNGPRDDGARVPMDPRELSVPRVPWFPPGRSGRQCRLVADARVPNLWQSYVHLLPTCFLGASLPMYPCFLCILAFYVSLVPLFPSLPGTLRFPSCHQRAGIVLVVVSPEMSGNAPPYLLERMPPGVGSPLVCS